MDFYLILIEKCLTFIYQGFIIKPLTTSDLKYKTRHISCHCFLDLFTRIRS